MSSYGASVLDIASGYRRVRAVRAKRRKRFEAVARCIATWLPVGLVPTIGCPWCPAARRLFFFTPDQLLRHTRAVHADAEPD